MFSYLFINLKIIRICPLRKIQCMTRMDNFLGCGADIAKS